MSNPFDTGGANYAAHRPTYPADLAATLAGLVETHDLAVDVGCGSGQLSILLAEHFSAIKAFDPSASQLSGAVVHPKVSYGQAPAEVLPVEALSVNLITAAQAAHWFDRPKFYAEVRRIAAPGAAVALIAYKNWIFEGAAFEAVMALYEGLDAYWRPERRDVENGYADFEFPFDEFAVQGGAIEQVFDVEALCAYIETWSATVAARRDGQTDFVDEHLTAIRTAWGEGTKPIRWPIAVRAGRV